jgi:hypothetical protein
MIQKTKSRTRDLMPRADNALLQEQTHDSLQSAVMSPSVGDQVRTKRATPESAWRIKAYEGSTAFMEALVVVQHDLRRAAAKHPTDVKEFLSWVRENGLTMNGRQVLKKIKGFHKDVDASLRLYVGFVLRFNVHLEYTRRNDVPEFEPNYEAPRHSQLKVGVRGGELTAPQADPDADVRDLFASVGGTPVKIRIGIKRKDSRILMSQQRREDDAELVREGLSEEDVALLRET